MCWTSFLFLPLPMGGYITQFHITFNLWLYYSKYWLTWFDRYLCFWKVTCAKYNESASVDTSQRNVLLRTLEAKLPTVSLELPIHLLSTTFPCMTRHTQEHINNVLVLYSKDNPGFVIPDHLVSTRPKQVSIL